MPGGHRAKFAVPSDRAGLIAAPVEGLETVAEIFRQCGVADHEIGIARGYPALRLGDRDVPVGDIVIA